MENQNTGPNSAISQMLARRHAPSAEGRTQCAEYFTEEGVHIPGCRESLQSRLTGHRHRGTRVVVVLPSELRKKPLGRLYGFIEGVEAAALPRSVPTSEYLSVEGVSRASSYSDICLSSLWTTRPLLVGLLHYVIRSAAGIRHKSDRAIQESLGRAGYTAVQLAIDALSIPEGPIDARAAYYAGPLATLRILEGDLYKDHCYKATRTYMESVAVQLTQVRDQRTMVKRAMAAVARVRDYHSSVDICFAGLGKRGYLMGCREVLQYQAATIRGTRVSIGAESSGEFWGRLEQFVTTVESAVGRRYCRQLSAFGPDTDGQKCVVLSRFWTKRPILLGMVHYVIRGLRAGPSNEVDREISSMLKDLDLAPHTLTALLGRGVAKTISNSVAYAAGPWCLLRYLTGKETRLGDISGAYLKGLACLVQAEQS